MLLAARERGYRSLMRLNSRAFLETPVHQAPHIKFEWLEDDAEDLIALTGGPGRADLAGAAVPTMPHLRLRAATGWPSLFGDRLYVELQRHGIDKERRVEAGADRSRLWQGPAAGRDQRAVFRHRRRLRSP